LGPADDEVFFSDDVGGNNEFGRQEDKKSGSVSGHHWEDSLNKHEQRKNKRHGPQTDGNQKEFDFVF
jgi:hypothetical protein